MGLQYKSVDDIAAELTLPVDQVLALFNKSLRKISQHFRSTQEKAIGTTLSTQTQGSMEPLEQSLNEELHEGEVAVQRKESRNKNELMSTSSNVAKIPQIISVKRTKRKESDSPASNQTKKKKQLT